MATSKLLALWAIVAEAWRWPAVLVVVQWQRHVAWQRAAVQWLASAPWAGLRRSGAPWRSIRTAGPRPPGSEPSAGPARPAPIAGSGALAKVDPLETSRAEGATRAAWAVGQVVAGSLALPFEMLRAQHAAAALAGAVPMSAIEAARFGQALEAAERLALGPFARRR
jgi:hypothetical protein